MSQVNLVKALRDKHNKFLAQNRGQTTLIDIKSSSYSRPRTTNPYTPYTKNNIGTEKKKTFI